MNPLIDSRQIIAFKILAETGSFTLTAKKLYLSQSAISHSIRSLEDDFNCKLFSRVGKKVHLTAPGESLLKYANTILAQMESAHNHIEEMISWGKGRIRIGASGTACQYILPPILREFRQCFPEAQIIIQAADTPRAIEQLRQNQTDLAITIAPQGIHECSFSSLFKDNLQFVASPMHPWLQKSSLSKTDIEQQNFILYSQNSYTFNMVQKHFRNKGIELKDFTELGDTAAIKELVKIGLGIGILADWTMAKELQEQSLQAIPASNFKVSRDWGLSYLKGKKLSLMEETFFGLCEAHCQNFQNPSLAA